MTDFAYRPPQFRSILIGIALVVILLVLLCSLSQAVKWIGAAFLFLPDRLGLVRMVTAEEAIPVDLASQSNSVRFPAAGRYALFVADYDLLKLTDDMSAAGASPWLTITSVGTGARLPIEYVTRGLVPYDTPVVPGRPVLAVQVSEAGEYVLVHTVRRVTIWIVPDYTTGNESRILAVIAAQVLILLIILGSVYIRRQQQRQERLATLRPPLPKV
jgi:hypothetical protein